jgi:hypothetical protein
MVVSGCSTYIYSEGSLRSESTLGPIDNHNLNTSGDFKMILDNRYSSNIQINRITASKDEKTSTWVPHKPEIIEPGGRLYVLSNLDLGPQTINSFYDVALEVDFTIHPNDTVHTAEYSLKGTVSDTFLITKTFNYGVSGVCENKNTAVIKFVNIGLKNIDISGCDTPGSISGKETACGDFIVKRTDGGDMNAYFNERIIIANPQSPQEAKFIDSNCATAGPTECKYDFYTSDRTYPTRFRVECPGL